MLLWFCGAGEFRRTTATSPEPAAATGSVLHLIRPLGFDISGKADQQGRAGITGIWWSVRDYENLDDFFSKNDVKTMRLFSTKAPKRYDEADYPDGCYLFFGKETKGRRRFPCPLLSIARENPHPRRSAEPNLGNSAAIGVFEALRQQGFPAPEGAGKNDRLVRSRAFARVLKGM